MSSNDEQSARAREGDAPKRLVPRVPQRPSVDDAARRAGIAPLSPAEERELDGGGGAQASFARAKEPPPEEDLGDDGEGYENPPDEADEDAPAEASPMGRPGWVVWPEDLKAPRGKIVTFMRFRAAWTDTPEKGDRQCIMWNLNYADEKLAGKRAKGDAQLTLKEMAKAMVRAVDGARADFTGDRRKPGSIDRWWDEIGLKCRTLVTSHFMKMHNLGDEERIDFFANCLGVESSE
jgi:hypothetical protein